MANLNNNLFIHDTGLNEENSLMHLLDVISPDEEDDAILLEHSKYFDDLSFKNTLCKQNGKISILSLNCQSINAKFDKLNFFIDYINDHIPISVICIQESWGHEEIDMRLFTLPNYKMVNQNRRLSTHGGLITYVHEDFSYRELNADLPITLTSTLFESFSLNCGGKTVRIKNTLSVIYIVYHYTCQMMCDLLLKNTLMF